MNICIDTNAKYSEIVAILAGIDDICITACYEDGSTESYHRSLSTSEEMASYIIEHLEKVRYTLNEMAQAQAAMPEEDEERIEAMYKQYLAEQEFRYDAEDATLHHYFA